MRAEVVHITPGGVRFTSEEEAKLSLEIVNLKKLKAELEKQILETESKCTHIDNFVQVKYSDYSESYTYRIMCKCCLMVRETKKRNEVPAGSELL